MTSTEEQKLRDLIRTVEDFPKPGISFKDITPLLADPHAFNTTLDALVDFYQEMGITKVCGVESRGFIFGAALAGRLHAGFIPIRKAGKLPYITRKKEYDLEYGSDMVEIHEDAIDENDIVLIHDDLLATGGTMGACVELIRDFKPKEIHTNFIIELSFLEGREKLSSTCKAIHSILTY